MTCILSLFKFHLFLYRASQKRLPWRKIDGKGMVFGPTLVVFNTAEVAFQQNILDGFSVLLHNR